MALLSDPIAPDGQPAGGDAGLLDAIENACILVVDDHEPNVLLLQAVLRTVGLTNVHSVTDPRQVGKTCRAVGPDLVLLDLHMPHMDGFAVLAELQAATGPDEFLPVIVLTADATSAAKQRALAAGARDFLTKPFDRTEVILRVRNLLEARRLYLGLRRHNADLAERLRMKSAEEDRRLAERHAGLARIRAAMEPGALSLVFQPIIDLRSGATVGLEALSRFRSEQPRRPEEWFAEAARLGLGVELELCAVQAALACLEHLPDDVFLSLNVSPDAITDRRFATAFAAAPAGRIVLELTEHVQVQDYDLLNDSLSPLRHRRARLAVDDAGAGFAGLQHILRLLPDIIKLDMTLTRDVDSDPARRALAVSLVGLSHELQGVLVAEGIETAAEMRALRDLEVPFGQGFHLGRPAPLIHGFRREDERD